MIVPPNTMVRQWGLLEVFSRWLYHQTPWSDNEAYLRFSPDDCTTKHHGQTMRLTWGTSWSDNEAYLRFSPENSLSRNLENWSFPAGSINSSSTENAHRFTRRNGRSRADLGWRNSVNRKYMYMIRKINRSIDAMHRRESVSRAWCKTIVTTSFYIRSYNSFAPSPQYVLKQIMCTGLYQLNLNCVNET